MRPARGGLPAVISVPRLRRVGKGARRRDGAPIPVVGA